MAKDIDPYAYCPCGSGKKMKFCCADMSAEIERIQEMLEGGQRAAALEFIETAEKKFPDRAYLVTTKALLQSILGSDDKAAATLEDFLSRHPKHPVALAEMAVVTAARHGSLAGIQPLQKAMEASEESISGRVVASVSRLGEMLLMEGRVAAARGHFMLAYSMNPNDEVSLQLLSRFFQSPNIPLVLKNEQTLVPAPAGVPWQAEFDAAVTEARRGLWWRAADKLKNLTAQAGESPELWRNLAVLRSWLADMPGSIAALRKLASLKIPLDDAVEAEALAQIYDGGADQDVVDELRTAVDLKNLDAAVETFASTKRLAPFNWESLGIDFGDQPPPRAGYFLLDRELPATGVGIARTDVPKIIARLLVFGRQTDREAHVDVYCRRPDLEAAKQALGAVLPADALGSWGESEKIDDVPVAEASLSWSWRLPDDTPPAHIRELVEEQRRDAVLNIWTNTPAQRFGGKTPAEAAGDAQYRLSLAAAVLLIELSFSQASTTAVFDELRSKLGIAPPETPEPAKFGPLGVPYTRLHRLDAAKLSDDELAMNFQRALQVIARQAVRKLGLELVGRPSVKDKLDVAGVYGHLADIEEASDEAIRFIELARKAAEEKKQSTAPWDLEELELRLRRGEPQEFGRLVEHIQSQHLREPGVAQALMQILYQAGIIGPDGRPRGLPPGMGAAAPAAESNKLWTPDAGPAAAAAPAAGGATKSGLWVPGMD